MSKNTMTRIKRTSRQHHRTRALAVWVLVGAHLWAQQCQALPSFEEVDCKLRELAYQRAQQIQPWHGNHSHVFDALRLAALCNLRPRPLPKHLHLTSTHTPNPRPTITPTTPPAAPTKAPATTPTTSTASQQQPPGPHPPVHLTLYINPTEGTDTNPGTDPTLPLATLHHAVSLAAASPHPTTLLLSTGPHYLPRSLHIPATPYPLTIAPQPHATPTLSGGHPLHPLSWTPLSPGSPIYTTPLPPSAPPSFNTLFVNNRRAVRARYPNGDPSTTGAHTYPPVLLPPAPRWLPPVHTPPATEVHVSQPLRLDHYFQEFQMCFGGPASVFDPPRSYWACNSTQGGAAHTYSVPSGLQYDPDTFSPRAASWKLRPGMTVHAFHGDYWGGWMFEVQELVPVQHLLKWGRNGGWQEARGWGTGAEWYVENVLEELDTPGEWYLDVAARQLLYYPNATDSIHTLEFVAGVLPVLVEARGSAEEPVTGLRLQGLEFAHTATTFMAKYEVPSGGDWSIHRGAAVVLEGVQNATMEACRFNQIGGNALLVSRHARQVAITRNEFSWIGDSAVVIVGTVDLMDGTSEREVPVGTLVQGNLIREVGIFGKQAGGVFQALARGTVVLENVIFNGPRSAVNLNDGLGGGNVVEGNVMFNVVRETADHGPVNSWDRLPYLMRRQAEAEGGVVGGVAGGQGPRPGGGLGGSKQHHRRQQQAAQMAKVNAGILGRQGMLRRRQRRNWLGGHGLLRAVGRSARRWAAMTWTTLRGGTSGSSSSSSSSSSSALSGNRMTRSPAEYTLHPARTTLRHNLVLSNYHSSFPLDHDDGTCFYSSHSNVLIYGGFKDYLGHSNEASSNLYLLPDVGPNLRRDWDRPPAALFAHNPFCAFSKRATPGRSGYGNVFANNTCVMWNNSDVYQYFAVKGWEEGWEELVPKGGGNVVYTKGVAMVRTGEQGAVTFREYVERGGLEMGSEERRCEDVQWGVLLQQAWELLMPARYS